MGFYIPLGIESFADMREDDYYYVDKTNFIKELLSNKFKANLITRKRYLEGIDEFETVVSYGIAFYGKKCVLQLYPTEE